MIREFKEEIERLRKLLAERDAFSGAAAAPGGVTAGGGALMADMLSLMAGAGGGGESSSGAAANRPVYEAQQAAAAGQGSHQGPEALPGVRPDYASPVKQKAPAMQVGARTPSPTHFFHLITLKVCPSFRCWTQDTDEVEYSPDKDHNAASASGYLAGAAGNMGTMSPAERERSLREDVENRLHQLENMVSAL